MVLNLPRSGKSNKVKQIDRSDAVNLARNMVEREGNGITPNGVMVLCSAVLRMDAELNRLSKKDKKRRIESLPKTMWDRSVDK